MNRVSSLSIIRVGVDFRHAPDFVIDRPRGSGDYLFLHFTTPIQLRDDTGTASRPAGTCILYAPSFTQWYRGADGAGLANDWVHFTGAGVKALVAQAGLPVNHAFLPTRREFIAGLLSEASRELARRDRFCEEVAALELRQLLLLAGRHHAPVTGAAGGIRLTPRRYEMRERLQELRLALQKTPESAWTVPAMAQRCHLSVSRFTVLYTSFFGASPMEDVMLARLEKARWLLTNSALTIGEVAGQSGFNSMSYFSRLFRQRFGCTPSHYYRALA